MVSSCGNGLLYGELAEGVGALALGQRPRAVTEPGGGPMTTPLDSPHLFHPRRGF